MLSVLLGPNVYENNDQFEINVFLWPLGIQNQFSFFQRAKFKWEFVLDRNLSSLSIIARQPDRVSLHPPRTLRPGDFCSIGPKWCKNHRGGESWEGGAEIPYLAAGLLFLEESAGGIADHLTILKSQGALVLLFVCESELGGGAWGSKKIRGAEEMWRLR